MIFWTIQTEGAWRQLNESGILVGSEKFISDQTFLPSYRWMRREMETKLFQSSSPNAFPIWAWRQWENAQKKHPDLRMKGHLPAGTKGIRIEFECEKNEVLLSDFELWHYVLNNWFLARSEKEREAFDLSPNNDGIQKSWKRIFDLDWSTPDYAAPKNQKSIQGTLWQLRMETVKRFDPFTAR